MKIKYVFLIGIIIRLISLYFFRNVTNYDLLSYFSVGDMTLKGVNIYPEFAQLHHPYFPFFLYIEAIAIQIERISIFGAIEIIKLILIFFDLGIIYLVYLLSKNNLKTVLIYALNPVTILVTTLHGQFDVIPVFFILLAIYLFKNINKLFSILSFSFAILTKTWPVLFVVPILRKVIDCHPRSSRSSLPVKQGSYIKVVRILILISIFPILFTAIYCLFFRANPFDLGKTLLSYQGLWAIWGPLSLLAKTRILWQKLATIIFLISFFIFSYFNKENNILKNILNLLFFFFVFTTNFSIQYFVWIIPFLIIVKPKYYIHLILLISMYLYTFYHFLLFCQNCNVTPEWLQNVQKIVGLLLWFSFAKIGYISSK